MKTFIQWVFTLLAALMTTSVRLANKVRGNAAFRFDQWLDRRKDAANPCLANDYTVGKSADIGVHNGQMPCWVQSAVAQRYLLYNLSKGNVATPIAVPATMPHGTVADETMASEVATGNLGYYNGAGVSGAEKALQILGNGLTKIMVPAAGYTPAYGDEAFGTSGGYITARPTTAGTYWKVGVIIAISMDNALVEVSDTPAGKLVI